jgi:hypothetical protein
MSEPIQAAEGILNDLLKLDVSAARNRLHPRVHVRATTRGDNRTHQRCSSRGRPSATTPVLGQEPRPTPPNLAIRGPSRHISTTAASPRLEQWECEQRLYLDADVGLIHRIDLLSSGCHRISSAPVPTVR